MKHSILLVATPDAQIAAEVRNILSDMQIIDVPSGYTALAVLASMRPSLLIIDTAIPDMRWPVLIPAMRAVLRAPDHPVLLLGSLPLTGLEPGKFGMVDTVGRPPHPIELQIRVATLLQVKLLQDHLEDTRNILISFAHALEARDPYTRHHSERTACYAAELSAAAWLGDEAAEEIRVAGLLHDIGKIGVPDAILSKRGRLTQEEYTSIKIHPLISEQICSSIAHFQPLLPAIRHHHEHIDGTGYPDALTQEAIPVSARIIAIADAYYALTSTRPYRHALTPAQAIKVITAPATQWDSDLVDVFVSIANQEPFVGLAEV